MLIGFLQGLIFATKADSKTHKSYPIYKNNYPASSQNVKAVKAIILLLQKLMWGWHLRKTLAKKVGLKVQCFYERVSI